MHLKKILDVQKNLILGCPNFLGRPKIFGRPKNLWTSKKKIIDDDPHPFARSAEKIFDMIATREPFAPKVQREFFFQKLNPETAKTSLRKFVFFFTLVPGGM